MASRGLKVRREHTGTQSSTAVTDVTEVKLLNQFRALSEDRRQEVLDFVEFIHERRAGGPAEQPERPLQGMFADLGLDVSEEMIDEARRAMFARFPREIED